MKMKDLKPLGIKPLKVWFDADGIRHTKFDREQLKEFVKRHREERLAIVQYDEKNLPGFIPCEALAKFLDV
jgi:hypothetical protein